MMARSHALSGAAGWLTAAALSTAAGLPWTPSTVLVGTVVTAGAAMLPDIDCPDSHAGRSLGPITNRLARAVAASSHRVYERTATPLDRSDRYRRGHRGVTHTIAVAVALGLAVTALAFTPAGPAVSGVVLFFTATLAARGLLSWKTRHVWIGPRRGLRLRVEWAPWVGVLVALDLLLAGHPGTWWWLGAPVAAGMVLHDLGDTPTHHADYPPRDVRHPAVVAVRRARAALAPGPPARRGDVPGRVRDRAGLRVRLHGDRRRRGRRLARRLRRDGRTMKGAPGECPRGPFNHRARRAAPRAGRPAASRGRGANGAAPDTRRRPPGPTPPGCLPRPRRGSRPGRRVRASLR
jgi:membrane-bound metal-dependent hydrolase YbcI (DUF457 family)